MSVLEDQISKAEGLAQERRYEEALALYQQTAEEAAAQNALATAAHCYNRLSWTAWQAGLLDQAAAFGEEGVKRLADAPASPEMAKLFQEAARVQAFVGNMARGRELGKRALELGQQLNLREVQAEALNTLSMSSWGVEPPDVLIKMAVEAVMIADEIGNALSSARAHNNLGTARGGKMGDFNKARFHFRRAVELNTDLGFNIGILFGLVNGATMSLFLGDLNEARKQLKLVGEMDSSIQGRGAARFLVRTSEARLLRQGGKLDAAYDSLDTLHHETEESHDSQQLGEALAWLADVAYEMGRLNDVLPALERAPDEFFNPVWGIVVRAYQALAYAHQNRTAEMHTALDRARAVISKIPGTWAELWLELVEARITMLHGDAAQALTQYDLLLGKFLLRDMAWHHAHLRFETAQAAAAAGRESYAQFQLREAAADFKRLGVDYYVEKAQACLDEFSG